MIIHSLKNSKYKDESLRVQWVGVEGYFEEEQPKKDMFDTILKTLSTNDLSNKRISFTSSKEDTFLRVIYRDVAITNKITMKKLTNDALFDENRAEKSKSADLFAKEIIPAFIKRNKIRKYHSMTPKILSFDSSNLSYHDLSLIDRKSSLVSTLGYGRRSEDVIKEVRSTHLSRMIRKAVPDLKDAVNAEALVGFFVKEFKLKKNLSSEFELSYENMYNFCIKKDKSIFNMLKKNLNMLPADLINLIKKEMKSKSAVEVNVLQDDTFDRELFFYTSLSSNYNCIIDEMANDISELSYLYHPLFLVTFECVRPNYNLIRTSSETILKEEVAKLNHEIKANKETPGSRIIWKIMEIVLSGEHNYQLVMILSTHCGHWLNNLLKSLFSSYSSVREESCLALAFILTRPVLMNELIKSKQFDVLYDMFVIVLRAIERFPENISSFYSIMGYILQKSSSVEIIDYILEVGPNLTNAFLTKQWPKLLYYALKYWPRIYMNEKPGTLRKIIDILQDMILRNKAKKMSKTALYFLCRKFTMYPMLVTVWYDSKENKNM